MVDSARYRARAIRIAVDRKHVEIADVRENVEQRDETGAHHEREWKIALRILHLRGGERDVVPGIAGEEGPHERGAECHDEGARHVHGPGEVAMPKIRRERGGVSSDRHGEKNEKNQRASLYGRERGLNEFALA